ncbi:hypothetical protein BGW36DRAFT_12111 [Talaromyces proteolyticus]|uniref:DUF4604 domain-containing protein n=1 Tax=Talaromyces proteolyticus TaxID=1131652 RepID=A0AAD4L5A9_9EURO|nr:uncharacterized protein BGW36DRAFT_12111 [Talaromyces proteolyticus]KAH8705346.1 hypothetical protein BGW36DRAFT_12111 [Talaromyces proteolyticus]
MAFNAKNLSYDRQEPAFLRKLRNQYGEGDSVRHANPSQRPRKPKTDDDDDAPTYVDEETNDTISKEDYEALLKGGEEKAEIGTGTGGDESQRSKEAAGEVESAATDGPKVQKNLAEIGSQKRKKQVKVVGADDDEADGEAPHKDGSSTRKPKAKKKKVKLSFDEA